MSRAATRTPTPRGEPLWEIAELLPDQGSWSENAYLALHTRKPVEFDDGMIDVLPVPTRLHQLIIWFLCQGLELFIKRRNLGGRVYFAGYRLRTAQKKYRGPDVLYLTSSEDAQAGDRFTDHATLVMEVVSPDDPDRDYVKKRKEYAEAGIAEYWIVDREKQLVFVLCLERSESVEHGRFGPGETATSHLLSGFTVSVDEILAQGRQD